MDYDQTAIAANYDTARGIDPEAMRNWVDLVAQHAPVTPNLIVDIGCGTGRFTLPLAERFPARIVGIDPSETMLRVARAKTTDARVAYMQAPAERLPFGNGSVDLVFMSMMLHHLDDKARAAQECRRVLAGHGRLCVRNTTRDSAYPQQRFFPGLAEIISSQLPSRDEVIRLLESAGLRLDAYRLVPHCVAASWGELAGKLSLRADSFLVRLPEAEVESGLAAMRAHAARNDPEPIIEHIHFFAFAA